MLHVVFCKDPKPASTFMLLDAVEGLYQGNNHFFMLPTPSLGDSLSIEKILGRLFLMYSQARSYGLLGDINLETWDKMVSDFNRDKIGIFPGIDKIIYLISNNKPSFAYLKYKKSGTIDALIKLINEKASIHPIYLPDFGSWLKSGARDYKMSYLEVLEKFKPLSSSRDVILHFPLKDHIIHQWEMEDLSKTYFRDYQILDRVTFINSISYSGGTFDRVKHPLLF